MGTAAAPAGAAGPSEGLRAGWSSGRTEAGVPRGERITRLQARADDRDSEPDYLLRPTRHGPGGNVRDSEPDYLLRPTRHGPGGTLLDFISVLFIICQLIEAWDHWFESAQRQLPKLTLL